MSGNERELSQRYPGSADREPMALDRARLILQGVVDVPEDAFTEDYDALDFGDLKSVEVREALTVVATDLLATHPHKDKLKGLSLMSKQTLHGRLTFGIVLGDDPIKGAGHVGQPEVLQMELTNEGRYILESAVLLENRNAPWVSHGYKAVERFSDWRGKNRDVIFMNKTLDDQKKGEMDKLQKIRHGLRWVAYNMLNWDNDFKLPEDINKSPLPSKV